MLEKRTKRRDFHSSQGMVLTHVFMTKHRLQMHRDKLGCLHVCVRTCVYVCVHKRITHIAFFHWQPNTWGTFTQGGSKRFKLLQGGVGLNQCPSHKQYNRRCLSSSYLFFKKSGCALSISTLRLSPLSGPKHYFYRSTVLRLDSTFSCPI